MPMLARRLAQISLELPPAPAEGPWPTETLLFTQIPLVEAEALMREAVQTIQDGAAPGHRLVLTEHPLTCALGTDLAPEEQSRQEAFCAAHGIECVADGRRGGARWLGPGQLVGHLAFALDRWRRDPDAFVGAIERIVQASLGQMGVVAERHSRGRALVVAGRTIATVETRVTQWVARARFVIHMNTDLEAPGRAPEGDELTTLVREGVAVARQDELVGWVLKYYEEELGSRPLIPQRGTRPTARPPWLRTRLSSAAGSGRVASIIERGRLHTVCESARCPNQGECWGHGTATFMINGNVCTRSCSFCAVLTGRPLPIDEGEPRRVAEAAREMGLDYVVVTAVNRDELRDGGAGQFAATIRELRRAVPQARVEVLIPDFKGDAAALAKVFEERPDVLNHNIETVPRLYPRVRPQAVYQRSLDVLRAADDRGLVSKSGIMLGLGEEDEEVEATLRDLRAHGCRIVTIGQYLRPSNRHHPVIRYVTPAEFARWREVGLALGFAAVESAPFVRSSYHAHASYERTGV